MRAGVGKRNLGKLSRDLAEADGDFGRERHPSDRMNKLIISYINLN